MLDWLKTLNLELQMLDHIEDVKSELTIDPAKLNNLGPVPEDVMKLYTLFVYADQAHDESNLKLKWDPTNHELKSKTAELNAKAQALHYLLSIALKEAFKAWDKGILIAKGNIAYSFDIPGNGPEDFLKRLLGGE